jgi:hypothetical protein
MAVYRFKSHLVYVEAKGDFDIESQGKVKNKKGNGLEFDPLREGAFNVRYFSAEATSESVTPEGPRELISLGASESLTKGVTALKYLPFQVQFVERYPSSWSELEVIEESDPVSVEPQETDIESALPEQNSTIGVNV